MYRCGVLISAAAHVRPQVFDRLPIASHARLKVGPDIRREFLFFQIGQLMRVFGLRDEIGAQSRIIPRPFCRLSVVGVIGRLLRGDNRDQSESRYANRCEDQWMRRAPTPPGVDDGRYATFQLRRPRHGDGADAWQAAKSPRNGHEVAGVVRSLAAGGKHEIIAGAFPFGTETLQCHPDQRIEPVQTRDDRGEELSQAIAALYMGQFVQQHHTEALFRPLRRFTGQQDDRVFDAPCDRHRILCGEQKRHGAVH